MMPASRSQVVHVAAWILGIGALLYGCVARLGDWWGDAERAVAEAVRATAEGRPPRGVEVAIDSVTHGGSRWSPATDFRRPYTVEGVDNFPAGSSPMDFLDVTKGVYVAHLVFAGGHEYHVEAMQHDGRWSVSLSAAEGSP